MKTVLLIFITLLLLHDVLSQEIGYSIQPRRGIDTEIAMLNTAKTLKDLHPDYPDMMIAKDAYLSTVLKSNCNKQLYSASSLNDKLSEEQKKMLSQLKQGCYIEVEVNYYQQNPATLNSDLRKMAFNLRIAPTKEATFIGGEEKLLSYFKQNISETRIAKTLATEPIEINFIIDQSGKATALSLTTPTEDESSNQELLDLIRTMPSWLPAENIAGEKIVQEYVFTAGNMVGC